MLKKPLRGHPTPPRTGKVKVSLPKSYHSADATKGKILVLEGVSNNVTPDNFKGLLDCNKIAHAEAERMKSKRPSFY